MADQVVGANDPTGAPVHEAWRPPLREVSPLRGWWVLMAASLKVVFARMGG